MQKVSTEIRDSNMLAERKQGSDWKVFIRYAQWLWK